VTAAFDHQTLTPLVTPFLGSTAISFAPIQTGKHNQSYWVDCGSGRFVLRIAPPDDAGFLFYERLMMRQEPQLHTLIRAKTNLPVAEVVGYDFSRTRIDRDYLLLTAFDGLPLSEATGLSDRQRQRSLYQIGEYLRELHQLIADESLDLLREMFGYLGAHQPMEPQPTWEEAFRMMWNKLLDDVVACGSYTPTEAQAMRDLYELYQEQFYHPVKSSLLHMDVWSQNILVDETGQVTGLVDFDRALWGDVEIEFAVLDYCGISEPAFWDGYGSPRDESPAALIRRQFYLLYEIQKYMPIRVWRRRDLAGANRYKQQSFQLASQLLPNRSGRATH
jgi:fructosamine-3-kinase